MEDREEVEGLKGERNRVLMEPEEIGVVMARASELHSSICDAFDRVTQSRIRGCGSLLSFEEYAIVQESSSEEEAHSLAGIRMAVEALETQLESLQSVQQQQRIRKDAALAKLEESRRLLLLRLKQHNGLELELVQEATAFVEEPVKKAKDVSLIPPLSPSLHGGSPALTASKGQKLKPSLVANLEHRHSFNDSLSLADDLSPHSQTVNCKMGPDIDRNPLSGRLSKALSGMLNFTGKTLLVVASVAAILVVSELNLKSKNNSMRGPSETLPQPVPEPKLEEKSVTERAVDYKRIEDDGQSECIERVELPFPRGVSVPDILYGRG